MIVREGDGDSRSSMSLARFQVFHTKIEVLHRLGKLHVEEAWAQETMWRSQGIIEAINK